MYTRCPTCLTCFRVTDRHLSIAKGKVRCGQCQLIFNAPEHAIDDLPVNQVTTPSTPPVAPTSQVDIKQTITPKKDFLDNPILSSLSAKAKEKLKPIIKPKIASEEKEEIIEIPKESPTFDSDATMIVDVSTLNKNDLENIDLDSPTIIQDNHDVHDDKDDDDIFNDDVDLNSAIDEFTDSTEDDDDENEIEENLEVETKQYIPENNDDVFSTNAYESTNASSVEEIMREMEGQLSLDIPEPNSNKEYDANTEFDFLKIDNEHESTLSENDAVDENDLIDDFEFLNDNSDENDLLEDDSNEIDLDDELFAQTESSDLPEEEIVLEDLNVKNIDSKLSNESFDDIPFQLRNDIEALQYHTQRQLHPLISLSFIVMLLLLSFSQFAYFRSHDLVNLMPSTRPMLEVFCDNIGCNYSGPRDIKQIQLLSRDVRLHPKEKKALLISAALINNANFAQPYPDIHIRLSDISGNVVAERIFSSKTYMGKLSNPFLLMKSKTPVHINFEVVDPGKDAINFEFTFL